MSERQTADYDATLTEAERDALWEAIDRAFLDTTTHSRESELDIEAAVEQIIANRARVNPPGLGSDDAE